LSDCPVAVRVAPDPGGCVGGEDGGHAHEQSPPHARHAFPHEMREFDGESPLKNHSERYSSKKMYRIG
jgi:hypothetical protein